MKNIPRIFIEKGNLQPPYIKITGTDVNYVSNVLRLKNKDKIVLLDGNNKEYMGEIEKTCNSAIICRIIKENKVSDRLNIGITLAQAIPKNKKMDLIIEKATELGVTRIIPMITERTIATGSVNKMERWKRIAKESSEQCGRYNIPDIDDIIGFDSVINKTREYDLAIMPWELEREISLKDTLKNNRGIRKLIVIIGSEGGFSLTEVKRAMDNDIKIVSLGDLILRVETATISTLSVLNYELRW